MPRQFDWLKVYLAHFDDSGMTEADLVVHLDYYTARAKSFKASRLHDG